MTSEERSAIVRALAALSDTARNSACAAEEGSSRQAMAEDLAAMRAQLHRIGLLVLASAP